MDIGQSEQDAGEYVLVRKLEGFANSDIVLGSEVNNIFSSHFDKLQFELPQKVDIKKLIDKIEDLGDDSPITVDYNPADHSQCVVSIKDLDYGIEMTGNSLSITSHYQTSPESLLKAYIETRKALINNATIKLIA